MITSFGKITFSKPYYHNNFKYAKIRYELKRIVPGIGPKKDRIAGAGRVYRWGQRDWEAFLRIQGYEVTAPGQTRKEALATAVRMMEAR